MPTDAERLATLYLRRKMADKDDLKWGVKQLENVLKTLESVAIVWSARGNPPEGLSPEGFESLADVYEPVNQAVQDIQGPISRDLAKIVHDLKGIRVRAARSGIRLDPKVKRNVARAFAAKGLDGNGRFKEPTDGFNLVWNILDHFGIVSTEITDSHQLHGRDQHHFNVNIGAPSQETFDPPTPINNSMLVFTYYKRSEENFEVLAYLS